MLQFFLCFILLAYSSPSSASISKHVFLLAGQSNMSGRGGVINDTWDGIVPPQCRPSPAVLRLDAALVWVEASEPLHRDMDPTKTCGVGPGMAFANRILEKDSNIRVVGLVPCAVGGTNITEWARGSFLYNQLVERARVAVRGGGALRGLLWYQGESDTVTREDAEDYRGRLEKFFIDLRADLVFPSLPVVQVALASGAGRYLEIVREAQLGMNLPNVKCVDAKGLPLEPDTLHLTTPSQVQLGEMLADAFLQYVPAPIMSNAPKRFHNFVLDFFRKLTRHRH